MQKEARRLIADQIVDHVQGAGSPEEARIKRPQRIKELQSLVQNQQLLERPNVVFTPHVAFNSVEAVKRINEVTVANIKAFFAGEPINVVNVVKARERDRSFGQALELASCHKRSQAAESSSVSLLS